MAPERIGKYRIESVLGQGGMGVVYRAFDSDLERTVALKVMLPGESVGEEVRARFLREARSAARLQHPNIVQVFDLGEAGGQLYIAMEYIAGNDLQELMRQKAVGNFERKLDLVMQVCAGLDFAHQHGVVHRDVKPANIRVSSQGVAKIMDFGIARLGASELTQAGRIMGTPHYMSPEQVRGQREIDGRSDQFSLGVILYELVGQQRPFDAEGLTSVMYHIVTEPHRDLRQLLPGCDPALAEAVGRALAKEASARFPSCQALADALRAVRQRLPQLTAELRGRVVALERECAVELDRANDRTLAGPGPSSASAASDPQDYGALLQRHASLEALYATLRVEEPTRVLAAVAVPGETAASRPVPAAATTMPPAAAAAGPRRRRWLVGGMVAVAGIGAGVAWLSRSGWMRPPSPPPGTLVLDVAPWARLDSVVTIPDRRPVSLEPAVSPATLSLPAGAYRLVLSNPYYPPALEVEVEVGAGQVVTVRRVLPGFKVEDEIAPVLGGARRE